MARTWLQRKWSGRKTKERKEETMKYYNKRMGKVGRKGSKFTATPLHSLPATVILFWWSAQLCMQHQRVTAKTQVRNMVNQMLNVEARLRPPVNSKNFSASDTPRTLLTMGVEKGGMQSGEKHMIK
jgi:hypothetical protein